MEDYLDLEAYGQNAYGFGGSATGQAPGASEAAMEEERRRQQEEMMRRQQEEMQRQEMLAQQEALQAQINPALDEVGRYGRDQPGVISSGHMGQYFGNTQRVAPQNYRNDPNAGLTPGYGGGGPGAFGARLADEYQSGRMTQADVYNAMSPAESAKHWDAQNAQPGFVGPQEVPQRDPNRSPYDYLPGSGIEYTRGQVSPMEQYQRSQFEARRGAMPPGAERDALDATSDRVRMDTQRWQDANRAVGFGPREEQQAVNQFMQQEAKYSAMQRQEIAKLENAKQAIMTSTRFKPEEKQEMMERIALRRAGISPSELPPTDYKQEQDRQKVGQQQQAAAAKQQQAEIKTKLDADTAEAKKREKFESSYNSAKKSLAKPDPNSVKPGAMIEPSEKDILDHMDTIDKLYKERTKPTGGQVPGSLYTDPQGKFVPPGSGPPSPTQGRGPQAAAPQAPAAQTTSPDMARQELAAIKAASQNRELTEEEKKRVRELAGVLLPK